MKELIRIDRYLANSSTLSRKEIRKIIKSGRVKLNENTVKDPGLQVVLQKDIVQMDDEIVQYKKYLYIMLNKPQGVITATVDNKHKTVLDLLPEDYKKFDLSPVGRLDKDTEGLLLITNNGDMNHKLTSPNSDVYKTYFSIIEKPIGSSDIKAFKEGVTLDDGYVTLPAELWEAEARENMGNGVYVKIKEGKFHQVKRMFEAIDNKVLFLKRIKMGPLVLDMGLLPGEYRELGEDEEKELLGLLT